MNLPSWILLIAILTLCSFIIYRHIKNAGKGGCSGCSSCASNKKDSCCH